MIDIWAWSNQSIYWKTFNGAILCDAHDTKHYLQLGRTLQSFITYEGLSVNLRP